MKTNDILLKFQSNNSKLETVLSKKKFSGDVKNLLLSMLYKISSSYNDYANIKVNVETKNKFVENMIKIINRCTEIQLVKPSSEEGEKFIKEGITSRVDTYLNTIKVFPTEKAMLFALFKMNDTKMYLDEEYNLIRIALPELLNEGRDINNIEIIRDFDAWSWNTLPSEISNIDCNLIYQNLQILLGFDFLDNWMKLEKQEKILKKLEDKLKEQYDERNVEELLNLLYRISIIVCIQRNKNEKKRLTEEREWDEKELERLSDKEKFTLELTKTKKEKAKEIGKLDEIINDENLLQKEFEKRNKNLSEYKKIYSLSNLLGTIKKERKKALNEIEECNKMMDAKNYVQKKEELEKNLDLLKETKTVRNKEKYKINIQKIFIKCLEEKVERITEIEQKKELVQILRILRYYNFIVYDEERFIKDVDIIKPDIEKLQEMTIEKLYELKVINPITKDIDLDINIIKPILSTRIMNLENVNMQIMNNGNKIEINVYDGNVLELEFELDLPEHMQVKNKRKVKLFVK
ncbi:MAG: hypothetical protein HFJ54_01740 [Clostridia bacterium]|nr:hypothetical protein [Clostridia bacterium]